ncbi:MAG TPA: acyltransferase [Candidatus Angelobacter sp.]
MKFLDTSSSRLPGLDLMRGLAILWVMPFHLRFTTMPSVLYGIGRTGWMGVDLFFVLSGYLIGSQLLRPYLSGSQPSLGGFYLRRAFRVLPAFLAVLLLYLLVPSFREAPSLSPVWQFLTFTENLRIDYLHDQAFSHVWSLCVEEHFYLVLPLLILVLMRKPSFAKALAAVIAILLFGFVVRACVYHFQLQPLLNAEDDTFTVRYVEKIYYPTYTRLDGLLMGVILALIKTFRPAWWRSMMAQGYLLLAVGLGLCSLAIWIFHDRFGFTGAVAGFPLLSLGLALIVASSLSPRCVLSRVRGFALPATLAYSLYLTHKEIGHLDTLYLNRLLSPSTPWINFTVMFLTSFIAAGVLYLVIERPFLRLRERISASIERRHLDAVGVSAK